MLLFFFFFYSFCASDDKKAVDKKGEFNPSDDDFVGEPFSKISSIFEKKERYNGYSYSFYMRYSHFDTVANEIICESNYSENDPIVNKTRFADILGKDKVYFIPLMNVEGNDGMYRHLQGKFKHVTICYFDENSINDMKRIIKIFSKTAFVLIQPYMGLYVQGTVVNNTKLTIYLDRSLCDNERDYYYTMSTTRHNKKESNADGKNETEVEEQWEHDEDENPKTGKCHHSYIQYYLENAVNRMENVGIFSERFLKFRLKVNFSSFANAAHLFVDFCYALDYNGWCLWSEREATYDNNIAYLNATELLKFRSSNEYISYVLYYDNTNYSMMMLNAFYKAIDNSRKNYGEIPFRFGIININTNGITIDKFHEQYPYRSVIIAKPKKSFVQGYYKKKSRLFKSIEEIENCYKYPLSEFTFKLRFNSYYYNNYGDSQPYNDFNVYENYYY